MFGGKNPFPTLEQLPPPVYAHFIYKIDLGNTLQTCRQKLEGCLETISNTIFYTSLVVSWSLVIIKLPLNKAEEFNVRIVDVGFHQA